MEAYWFDGFVVKEELHCILFLYQPFHLAGECQDIREDNHAVNRVECELYGDGIVLHLQ